MKNTKRIAALCLVLTALTVGTTFARYATTLSDNFRLNIIAEIYNLTLNADHGTFNDGTEVRTLKQASNKNFGVHNDITRDETVDGEEVSASTYTFLGWAYEKHSSVLTVDFEPTESIIVKERDTTLYAVWLREGPLTDGLFDDIGYVEGETTDLVIPGYIQSPDGGTWYEVTSIPSSEFYNDDVLKTVVIPDTVTSIGSSAFWSCGALTSVTIPESVTSIGADAFRYCQQLESVTIPSGVTIIADRTFYDCRSIQSLVIPEGVTSIGSQAFCQCYTLRNLTIPSSVTQISSGAFTFAGKDVGGVIISYDGTMEQWEKITATSGQNVWGGGNTYKVICTDGKIVGNEFVEDTYDLLPEENDDTTVISFDYSGIDDTNMTWYPISDYDDMLPRAGEDYAIAFQPNEGYALPEIITVEIDGTVCEVYTDGSSNGEGRPAFDPTTGQLTIPAALLTEETIAIRIEASAVAVAEAPADFTEQETMPICNCDTKCTAFNGNCSVCTTDISACGGKEPETTPTCNCDSKCSDLNADCPVCSSDIADCTGAEIQPQADDPAEEQTDETVTPASTDTTDSADAPSEEALLPDTTQPNITVSEDDSE